MVLAWREEDEGPTEGLLPIRKHGIFVVLAWREEDEGATEAANP